MWDPANRLPCEDLLSPEVYTSIFRQLWGYTRGGLEEAEQGGECKEKGEAEQGGDCTVVQQGGECMVDAEQEGGLDVLSKVSPHRLDEAMTAFPRPDTPSSAGVDINWKFDFAIKEGCGDKNTHPTNEDILTSVASVETLVRGWRTGGDVGDLEKSEIKPTLQLNPGPPFAVGNVIMYDVSGHALGMDPMGLQRGFVLEADHPKYQIRLETGARVHTNARESWLQPRYAPGQFAADQDDPFVDLQDNPKLKVGSYGLHVDSQHESLEKAVKAKALAKAVKADDPEVLIYLWNKRIIAPGVTQEQRDAALTALRKLEHRWFLSGLLHDCVKHVCKTHVTSWKKPR
jgi:hypothetical protein